MAQSAVVAVKKHMKHIEKILSIGLVIYAVWFNFNLYKLEPTAKVDPNDNNFQYGLVDRTNQMWDFASIECKKQIVFIRPLCHFSLLADHWVPNWAQGYNLPFYYSHIPQIVIVATYRFIRYFVGIFGFSFMGLFAYYHWFIYVLLCLFPVAVYMSLRVIKLPWIVAGVGALFATHISTDGLYGLDPPSFLWRGWGLSSQLFAMLPLPLSLAYSWKFFQESEMIYKEDNIVKSVLVSVHSFFQKRSFWLAVCFTAATIIGHLGIGVMTLLSVGILAIVDPIIRIFSQASWSQIGRSMISALTKLALVGCVVIFLLSYWIIPTMLGNDYHNISYWDPIWKFNSYGWKETMIRLFNGDLFDYGRFPVLTLLVFVGVFQAAFMERENKKDDTKVDEKPQANKDVYTSSYIAFSVLFVFWLLMYFGRTTWGGVMDLIPSMSEFHLSRFIVGIHAAGLFLIPIGVWYLGSILAKGLQMLIFPQQTYSKTVICEVLVVCIICAMLPIIGSPVYRQTAYYNELNNKLILQANTNVDKVQPDVDELMRTMKGLPSGRVFAGRGGGWGKDFKVAETEMFIYISTFGLSTALWLPETWSPNSDTEQYFSEDVPKDYDLYNLRYVVAPPTIKPQPFWTEVKRNPFWILYETPTSGYFTLGTRNMIVVTDKESFINLVHLWIHSPIPTQKLFPQITFREPSPHTAYTTPTIRMIDEVTYKTTQGERQNIFAINPLYGGDPPAGSLIGPEKENAQMVFQTTVKIERGCKDCYIILKQTYHPNWRATVDGRQVTPIAVFPFFIAVPIATSGVHEVVVWYQPSTLKVVLLCITLLTCIIGITPSLYQRRAVWIGLTRRILIFVKKK